MRHITKPISLAILLVGLVLAAYFYYQHEKFFPNTDDAYVRANIVNIAPQVSGDVSNVYIHNHEYVKKGTLLFDISAKPFLIAINKANANLSNTIQTVKAERMAVHTAHAKVRQAEAQLINARQQAHRITTLVHQHLASYSAGDQTIEQLRVAIASLHAAKSALAQAIETLGHPGIKNAQVQAAKANLAQAILNLHYTQVVAPANGYINDFDLRKGQTVSAYQDLFALVESGHWWVSANYKETDLARIRPGQSATITLDMYPGHTFTGKVVSISTGSGATFSLLPPENASGNWVKVTQRFPVRVAIIHPNKKYPLRVGASSTVTINTQ